MPGKVRVSITPQMKREIVKIIDERIAEVHVTKEDFSELKSIVKELAEAQKRTETRVEELAEAQKRTETRVEELAEAQKRTEARLEELAEAQKRTEARLEELAEAQKRTETRVEELAEAQKRTEIEVRKLAIGLNDTRKQLGGLSRSFSYAFENEAYRNLPKVLHEKLGFEITEKMVRAEIGGKEINFFGKAKKDGKEVYIIGESKIRLDEGEWRSDVFSEIEQKIDAVKTELGEIEVIKIIVTHFATRGFLEEASNRGVIVIQSFEW